MKHNIFSILLVIALLSISLFAAGCAEKYPVDEGTPTATPAPTEEPTLVEPTEEPTAIDTEDGIDVPIIARVQAYQILPAGGLTINAGKKVTFRNFDNLKRTFVIVSQEDIWGEDPSLKYMRTVNYTFTEPGTYTFYVKPADTKKWTITVV